MNSKNSKGAMEMSVGMIVTIVLLVAVLVVGLFFISKIRSSAGGAIDSISQQVQNQIAKTFSSGDNSFVIYPNDQGITLKQGESGSGFAFSIKNEAVDKKTHTYNWSVSAEPGFNFAAQCGQGMTEQTANQYIILSQGEIPDLGYGQALEKAILVRFNIPKTALPCTIPYRLSYSQVSGTAQTTIIYVTIK